MIKLESFQKSPFDDDKISMANFRQLGFDCVERLGANNPGGIYTVRHTATKAAFDQYDAVFGSKTIEEALKKGATFGLGTTTKSILTAVRDLEKLVTLKFKNPSQVYFQFFPTGLTEFNNAGKGEWPKLLLRLKAATAAHSAIVGTDVVTEFAGYVSSFSGAEGSQVASKGTLDDLRDLLQQKRLALAIELFINLLTIALNNIGNSAAIKKYFDQSIVDRKVNSDTDGLGRGLIAASRQGLPVEDYIAEFYDANNQLAGSFKSKQNKVRSPNIDTGIYKVFLKKGGLPDFIFEKEIFDNKDEETEVEWEG